MRYEDGDKEEAKEPKKRGRPAKVGRPAAASSSVPRPAKKSFSAPTTLTPMKSASTTDSPTKSPFDNPTPAMIELMQRLKEKRQLATQPNSKVAAANKLLAAATSVANKSKQRLKPVTATNVKVVKKRGRPPNTPSPKKEEVMEIEERPVEIKVPKAVNGRGRSKSASNNKRQSPMLKSQSRERANSKTLSSSSSTQSSKENKYAMPARRSPRTKNV